jgi:putative restriction endonuclease
MVQSTNSEIAPPGDVHLNWCDRDIFGISPDYQAHVRPDILLETDGPILKHGVQEIDGMKIILPHRKADLRDKDRLHQRHELFQKAV